MILKISCPACQKAYRLSPPYPSPGRCYKCTCGAIITVSYPAELADFVARNSVSEGSSLSLELRMEPPPAAPTDREAAPSTLAATSRGPVARQPSPPAATRQALSLSKPGAGAQGAASDKALPSAASRKLDPSASPTDPARGPLSSSRGAALPTAQAHDTDAESTAEGATSTPKKGSRRRRWPWVLLILALMLIVAPLTAGWLVLRHYAQNLPSLDGLNTYRPAIPTQVFARDGRLIGEFFGEERRYVLEFKEIPQKLVQAFVAAEDASFFEHHGVDFRGIVRATLTNLREKRVAQGASTITQQVARSFLLTREKSIERKIIEALLAWQIEQRYTKEHILYLYLNQVYLGEGAYGVQAAARTYFAKDVSQLTLAEMALLAGLCPAPSRYSPLEHWGDARARQLYVLKNMQEKGYITPSEADAAQAEEVALKTQAEGRTQAAPFVTEQVRKYLVEKYGDAAVLTGGMKVHTTIDYDLQQAAQVALRAGVKEIDHHLGFRGPLKKLAPTEVQAWAQRYDESLRKELQAARPGGIERFGAPPAGPLPLTLERSYQAVLTRVGENEAIALLGSQEGVLRLKRMRWAYSVNPERNWKYRELDRINRVLNPGDVIEVRLAPGKSGELQRDSAGRVELDLEQGPAVEGSLFAYSAEDGAVVALVGGYDFARSEFNRPYQAKRQMGSAFKPLVYAAALDHPDKVYTPATILIDAPITLHRGLNSDGNLAQDDLWKPGNYDRDYLGEITLRKALYLSRNTVAVKVLDDLGVDYAYEYVKKFGFTSDLNRDNSLVLGTASVTLLEMCRAFSAFAAAGELVEPVLVERVEDRDGKVLEMHAPAVRPRVMPAATAYIMASMLQDVVRHGTATNALVLGKPVAGKTGTTNDYRDASFIGFTPQLVAGAWIGYDQPQNMGYGHTGGDTALPMWVDFMREALKKYPRTEFPVPPEITFAVVDEATGKLANESTARKVRLPFVKGEEPVETAPETGQVGTEDFLSADQAL